jgi:hypothetical protein
MQTERERREGEREKIEKREKREKREREREKLHPVKVSELIRKEAEGMLEWSLP